MLAKKYRLNVADFKAKKALEQRRNEFFQLKIFTAEALEPRFGLVVSKKVHAAANKRNALRRKIFDFFRTNKEKMKKNRDYIVIVSPRSAEISEENSAIVRHLESLFFKN
jgi:ribonuclease P protein component